MSRHDNVLQLAKAEDFGSAAVGGSSRAKHLVLNDRASRAMLELLDRVAPSDAAIQVSGETGTGKELVARYIHRKSLRAGPFIGVNCGAVSEHLAESEFFGHESGAFTGANARREGLFEAASGGTLFLDEIGDMPLALQAKLLRVLQEGEVMRIGARKTVAVNVRIVSATNVNLDSAVAAGRFRRDLFYRLNVVQIALPSLRDRPDDIAALAAHFAAVYGQKLKRPVPAYTEEALYKLTAHAWPGNIRELENVVHCALLTASETLITADDLRIAAPAEGARVVARAEAASPASSRVGEVLRQCFHAPGGRLLRDVERQLVAEAFEYCNSNQVRTAELLGVSRSVVRTLLKRYGLIVDGDEGGLTDYSRIIAHAIP